MRSEAKRERMLEFLFTDGTWFRFPKIFFKLMPLEEAIVLAFLMNYSGAKKASKKDGWFECRVQDLENEVGIPEHVQRRVIGRLQDANRLESEQRGLPSKRHFRINFIGIEQEIQDLDSLEDDPPSSSDSTDLGPLDSAGQSPSISADLTTCIKKVNKDCGDSAASSQPAFEDQPFKQEEGFFPDEESTTTPSNFDMRCAIELNAAVIKHHKNDRKNELKKWAQQFRLLRTRDNATKDQIKEVLKWYVALDWSEPFTPQAYSGKSFRDKFFEKLLPALQRSKVVEKSEDDLGQVSAPHEPQALVTGRMTVEEWDRIRQELD